MAVLPSNLSWVGLSLTGAAANAAASGTILPAPGSGLRYRLWSLYVGSYNTTQAPSNWSCDVTDWPVTKGFGKVSRSGFASGDLYWPGGLPWVPGQAVGYQLISALAALGFNISLGYTVEAMG